MFKRRWLPTAIVLAIVVGAAGWAVISRNRVDNAGELATIVTLPARIGVDDGLTRESSIQEVLQMARDALARMSTTCDDYTARLVKQELNLSGQLSEVSEINLKIQTRLRNDTDNAPRRVYLRFTQPASVNGREVIWCEDLHDGKLVVHEAGLLGLMTLRLDPEGILAMQGQRYPISEIGITRLVEKLIERGEVDRDNPEIDVTIKREHKFDDVSAELIQIRRHQPSESKDDFSLAEITFDPNRMLILSYRSFGWPDKPGQSPSLQESYAYHDLAINVGLSDTDFDPANPEYSFP
jgi:hypothetical protein